MTTLRECVVLLNGNTLYVPVKTEVADAEDAIRDALIKAIEGTLEDVNGAKLDALCLGGPKGYVVKCSSIVGFYMRNYKPNSIEQYVKLSTDVLEKEIGKEDFGT